MAAAPKKGTINGDLEAVNFLPSESSEKKNVAAQEPEYSFKEYAVAACAYSGCAACLLVVNKLSVDLIPSPSLVVASQLLFSAAVVRVLMCFNMADAEPLKYDKVKAFIGVSLLFTLCLVFNVKALQVTSVQTVIVMRSCSPLFVAFIEFFFLGTGFPKLATWLSLSGIAFGAGIYCYFDAGFSLRGYTWPLLYFVSICIEMVFVKHIINKLPMSTWTRVYYNNALGLLPVISFGLLMGESAAVKDNSASLSNPMAWVFLIVACVIGLGISFAGFHARKLLSATSFTVLGVSNKFISITLSLIFVSRDVSMASISGLALCIVSATIYAKTKAKK